MKCDYFYGDKSNESLIYRWKYLGVSEIYSIFAPRLFMEQQSQVLRQPLTNYRQ